MEIVTISNQKGGVGKSTVAVHMAMALAEKGNRVLFLDLDPQGNASKTMGHVAEQSEIPASRLYHQSVEDDAVETVEEGGMLLIAADPVMADIEREPAAVLETFRSNMGHLGAEIDYCIIDTPPTLGLRMTSALLVAHHVLAPVELEEYSIDGITKMLQTIYGIRDKWNPGLNFLGMLPNRFNPRSQAQKQTLSALIEHYSHLLIPARISTRSSIPEALSEGVPVWKHHKTSARAAGKEFMEAFGIVFDKMEVK
ncbi:ParA family protein (plasmid) [Guyparkeria sp. 1SP6A2]|nr:ParA family protein [Guyparkeria sp. 1SP6A2]